MTGLAFHREDDDRRGSRPDGVALGMGRLLPLLVGLAAATMSAQSPGGRDSVARGVVPRQVPGVSRTAAIRDSTDTCRGRRLGYSVMTGTAGAGLGLIMPMLAAFVVTGPFASASGQRTVDRAM